MGRGGAMKNKRRYLTSLSKMLQARASGQEEKEEELLEELDRIWLEMNEDDSKIINKITSLFARKRIGIDGLLRLSKAFSVELVDNESRIMATFAYSPMRSRRRSVATWAAYKVVKIRIRNDSAKTRRKPNYIRHY